MYCPKCGAKAEAGRAYCERCGYPLSGESDAEKKKKAPVFLAVMIVFEIVVIAIVGGIIVSKIFKSEKKTEDASDVSVEEEEIVEESEPSPEETQEAAEDVVIEATLVNDKTAAADIAASHWRVMADRVVSSGASSTIKQDQVQNPPINILDGDETTNWQEGVKGSGIGEYVYFTFDQEYQVDALTLKLGNWKDARYYAGNNRPKKLRITTDQDSWVIEFPEDRREFAVQFSSPAPVKNFQVMIEDVYMGTQWNDTVISEIGLWCNP